MILRIVRQILQIRRPLRAQKAGPQRVPARLFYLSIVAAAYGSCLRMRLRRSRRSVPWRSSA